MKKNLLSILAICSIVSSVAQSNDDAPKLTEVWEPIATIVKPGKTAQDAPSDAIVLFSGKDLSAWQNSDKKPAEWIVGDGAMTVKKGTGMIHTKQAFGDCQFHLEFREPSIIAGSNQTRANSGIWFMSNYEMQVLDNYNNPTYVNGMVGSLYKQHIPLVAVGRKPGEWQTYDILFTAPQFKDNGEVATPGRITAFLNGVLVLNNVIIYGGVEWIGLPKYKKHAAKMPFYLQDHGFDGGQPVSFRNIWIRPL